MCLFLFQRAEPIDLELLNDHHAPTHHLHHAGASSMHVPPLQVSPPASLFITEPRGTLEMLHRSRRLNASAAARRVHATRTRWHHNTLPLPTPTPFSGLFFHLM